MYILCIVIIFSAWVGYKIKKSNRYMQESSQNFWDNEAKANSTRKQSLDDLEYIRLDLSVIPDITPTIKSDETLLYYRDRILALSDAPIVNLTGFTNTELKLRYGVPNITYLSTCDENYTTLVNLIMRMGERLLNNGLISEGIRLLEYGITIGSDAGNNYYLLADYYLKNNLKDKYDNLLLAASGLNTINRNIIIKRLNDLNNSSVIE